MLDSREAIIDMIKQSGHKEGSKLLAIEKEFGIEFNVLQLQQVIRRGYGKSYLSYAVALHNTLATDSKEVNETDVQLLDEDVGFKLMKLKQWFSGFESFVKKQGMSLVRIDDFTVRVEV